ncbi:MAG: sodium:calcium antiporter [Alphaproteobacteria bacterium CG11_big_fil_rev_8_21_14_0_20_44_7]|nr:MAG: sodium:calcium antiporter [Alphaproteobacteria bacterium CG11_big_fil_rev_8_21_14_0_20_44_7]
MIIFAAQIIGGLILLFLGGESLVRGAVSVAEKLRVPALIVGLTIVAYGTSMPELVVSVKAATNDLADIALGNIIGSNISNILLVLGVSALVFPIRTDDILLKREGPLLIGITLLLLAFASTSTISALDGGILLVLTFVYTGYIIYAAKVSRSALPASQMQEIQEQMGQTYSWLKSLIFLAAGFVLLIYGGDLLVDGASSLASAAGISEAVIAVTIVALGTSAPELVTSLIAAYHKHSDVALGNVIGSCLFNIMGIMGVAPLFQQIDVNPKFMSFDFPLLLVVTLLLVIAMLTHKQISRREGAFFAVMYLIYIALQF